MQEREKLLGQTVIPQYIGTEERRLLSLPKTASRLLRGCKVVKVHDGDTLTCSALGRKSPLVVRVAEIDAPEYHAFNWATQPFAVEAQRATSIFVGGIDGVIDVQLNTFDPRTQRWIAHVRKAKVVNNPTLGSTLAYDDLSLYLATNGYAWSYLPAKKSKIPAAMVEAKSAKRGLWALDNPIEPSVWRRGTPKYVPQV